MARYGKYRSVFKSPVDGRFYGSNVSPDLDKMNALTTLRAALMPDDISDIEKSVILDEILGLAWPQYTLRNACRVIPMDSLIMRIDIATKFTGHKKVEPMEEADIKKQSYSVVNFDLWKNVDHVVIADETIRKAAHGVMDLHVMNAARDIARMENEQIAVVLEAATLTTAGSDWGTITNGRSANDPYTDLQTAFDSIEGTYGFPPTHMLGHPRVWTEFFGNDFVKGQLQGKRLPAGKIFDVPGVPGLTGVSDWGLTNTQCLVVSATAPAVVLGKGPTEMAEYRNEAAGYDAFVLRDWLEMQIVQEGAIYELTAIRA
jgi:hypothetical protein